MSESLPLRFGAFLLVRKLGQGGMGDVHLACRVGGSGALSEPVVLKRMLGNLAENEEYMRRFRHEGQIAVRLDSPNVARVYEVGTAEGFPYIAMQLIVGWSISEILEQLRDRDTKMPIVTAIQIAMDALSGLSDLHELRTEDRGERLGFVHRDIKTSNLMLDNQQVARLIDLGLGKSKLQDWKTETGALLGTPAYMPPEQARSEAVDHRSDIFAMGAVLFEMVTMRKYNTAKTWTAQLMNAVRPEEIDASSLNPEVPPGLDAAIRRALHLKPDGRFQSATEFKMALKPFAPRSRAASRAKSIVTEIMHDDIERVRTEVAELLTHIVVPTEIDGSAVDTEVFAQAEGFATRLVPMKTRLVDSPPPKSRGRVMVAVAGAGLIAAGVAFASTVLRPNQPRATSIPLLPPPSSPPSLQAIPSERPPDPPPKTAAEPREPAPKQRKPADTRVRRPRKRPAEKTSSAKPAAAKRPTLSQLVRAAEKKRTTLPADSPQARQLAKLLADYVVLPKGDTALREQLKKELSRALAK